MRSLPTIVVFSAFIAAFFVVMSTTKASNDRAEAECRAMVGEAMRDYPSMAMQVVNDCAGFRGSAEDVPPRLMSEAEQAKAYGFD